jgi:hypothetical protein
MHVPSPSCSGGDAAGDRRRPSTIATDHHDDLARLADGTLSIGHLPAPHRDRARRGHGPMITAAESARSTRSTSPGACSASGSRAQGRRRERGTGLDELLAVRASTRSSGRRRRPWRCQQLGEAVESGHGRRDVLAVGDGAGRSTSYPDDNSLFFRTVPSDSLRDGGDRAPRRAHQGVETVAVGISRPTRTGARSRTRFVEEVQRARRGLACKGHGRFERRRGGADGDIAQQLLGRAVRA